MILVVFFAYTICIWTAKNSFCRACVEAGTMEGVVLCFGVPGTGLTPTPATSASAGRETAKAFLWGLSGLKRWAHPMESENPSGWKSPLRS